jgi:excisionase family DNA binding protein
MMLDCIAHRERPTLMEIRALPEVLTVEQVAAYLQLSVEEVNTAILHGEIPAARFLNKWRVKREVVDELLRKPAVDLADNETKAKEPPQLDSRAMDPAQEAGQNAAITKQDDELLLPVLNTGIQVSSCNESYDESAPPISSSVTKGRVMVFNPTEGTGQARMRDMRIVNLDVTQSSLNSMKADQCYGEEESEPPYLIHVSRNPPPMFSIPAPLCRPMHHTR